jgi:hypothetical protein
VGREAVGGTSDAGAHRFVFNVVTLEGALADLDDLARKLGGSAVVIKRDRAAARVDFRSPRGDAVIAVEERAVEDHPLARMGPVTAVEMTLQGVGEDLAARVRVRFMTGGG